MTHPFYAEDEVGRICGDLSSWTLALAEYVMVSGRPYERHRRAEALVKLFEVWPKVTRRIAQLEAAARVSAEKGYARDADMQDVTEVVRERLAKEGAGA